jgi:hypothetical protein
MVPHANQSNISPTERAYGLISIQMNGLNLLRFSVSIDRNQKSDYSSGDHRPRPALLVCACSPVEQAHSFSLA